MTQLDLIPIQGTNDTSLRVDREYEKLQNAETFEEPNPWIRTRYAPPRGSSAYGPVQVTQTLAQDYLDRNKFDEDEELKTWIKDKFIPHSQLLLKHGRNKSKIENYNPIYDYGGEGDFTDYDKQMYERMSKTILRKKIEEKPDVDIPKFWHGTEPSKEYRKKYESGRNIISDFLFSSAQAAEQKLDLQPIESGLDLQSISKQKLDLQPLDTQKLNLQNISSAEQLEPQEKLSLFGKIVDILGRPGQAVKSYLRAGQEKTKEIYRKLGYRVENLSDIENLPPEAFERFEEEAAKVGFKREFKEAGQALWRGFSGKEQDTMNRQFKEWSGVEGVPLLGFAAELAVDPLMWFGGAGYKGITKGIGAIVKPAFKLSTKALGASLRGLEEIPKVGKYVTATKEMIPSIMGGLKTAFITKSGIGKLSELVDKHLLRREYLRGKEIRYSTKVRNVIQNTATKYGIGIDDVEKQIVNAIEQPQFASKALPEVRALSNTLRTHFENLLTTEMKAGVPITHLSEGARGIQYFPRITTKEAKQYLSQAKIGNAKVWNPRLANALQRKTGDFTLGEFNDFVRIHGLESLGGKQVEQFFMRNPAYATAIRGIRSSKAVTSAQFLDDVSKQFGISSETAAKTGYGFYQALPDTITKLNPSLKGKVFEPEVFSEINRIVPKYFNPNELKPLTKVFDSIQNTWKRWTLAPFPKYHIRNMVGNMWNNYLADVNPKNYLKSQALQTYRKYKNATGGAKGKLKDLSIRELGKFGISPNQADDIIKQAEQTGVLGTGWFGGDIETTIEKTMQQGFRKQPLNIKIKKVLTGEIGIEKGIAFGSTVENNARLAHFIDRIDKAGMLRAGASISDDIAMKSAQSVKKFLFDYGDLTAFEKQVMKRLFPFYTWTRKNVPLQLEQLWQQPQKFAKLAIPLRAREPQDLIKLKYARPDLYERLPIELRRDADTVTYVPLEGLLPAGDLTKMLRPNELFFEMLTPYLKAPLELQFNKSLFFESEVQRYDKETQELLKIDMPIKLKYAATTVLPQARLLNELNKLVKKQVRKEALTPIEQAFSQTLSSIYKVNLRDLNLRAKQSIERKIDDLVRGAKWAKRKGREEEYLRIRNTIRETMDLLKELR